jgi:transposase-like protein
METKGKSPRQFSADQKFKVVKEALTTDAGVSGVCRKYDITTGLYYKWQEKFFSGALAGFESKDSGPTKAELREIAKLESQNQRMKNVIAEITAENIEFKKNIGEL